jgi:tight adherence protein C
VRRYPVLAEQLKYLTLELRAGRSRRDAWLGFAERLGLEEARTFATMLRQAEDMGTSLGETLRVFSEDMRAKRMLRAEEKAMALPAKLIVPLILFIFPCLMGVLILPAAFRVSQTLAGQ